MQTNRVSNPVSGGYTIYDNRMEDDPLEFDHRLYRLRNQSLYNLWFDADDIVIMEMQHTDQFSPATISETYWKILYSPS